MKSSVSGLLSSEGKWWLVFSTVLVLSFSTRFYNVTVPDHVCWDETHFGKMGSWYINRTFFFDVHPPLGKMLIALSGYLTGYDGSFQFDKPGDKYEHINYVGMRMFCTFLGSCIAPISFLIVWELSYSLSSSFLSSFLIICDVGVLTLSQYILLDPILLFFIMLSTFGIFKFYNCKDCPFTRRWWLWLCFTGIMLACAVSVKFVGLFIVVFCGIHTIWQLWELMSDMSITMICIIKHFIARVFGLILLPLLLYITIFYIHLTVLNKSGNGDGFFSSAFQSRLANNSLHNASMPREVAYGAIITIKNRRTGGGYLHSHWHLFPEGVGARQQQVTTYTHKDDNNKWLIKPYQTSDEQNTDVTHGISFLKHGNLVRLEHVPTRRNLHSHKEVAPITKKHYQVTGYGENGTGDPNDIWKVHILGGSHGDVVKTVTSQIKFIHYLQHCVLTTTGKQLPSWAYEQQEVTCSPNLRDTYAYWNVEENFYPKLPNVSFDVYASSFVERLIESHAVMLQGNAGLKPKDGEITSRPWQWPINYRGQFFSGNSYRVYLLGNPVIWWINLSLLIVLFLLMTVYLLLKQRGKEFQITLSVGQGNIQAALLWLFVGWSLHYIPFWVMGRVLYFHHYFPALLFSSMLSGIILNCMIEIIPEILPSILPSLLYHWCVGLISSVIVYSFYIFSPLAYGMSGPYASDPNSTMHTLKWMDSWEF